MNGEYEKALNALKEKDFEKAKLRFSKIIEKTPESGVSHLGLSYSLLELDDDTGVEKHFKAAFGLFEAQRKLPEAYISLKNLIHLRPEEIKYNFDLLRILIKLGLMKLFGTFLLEMMDNQEISEELFKENVGTLVSFVEDETLKELLKFGKKEKKKEEKLNPFENHELANLLFEIGSTDEAKNEYYKTTRAFLNRDLKDKAQELYVKIKELYPDDSELESLKQEIDSYGKEEESMNFGERRKKLEGILPSLENENEPRIRYSFAIILKEYARFEDAKEELERIKELPKCPEKVKAYVLLSQIYMDEKDNTKAVDVLEQVTKSDEFSGTELAPLEYKLGTIYERIDRLEDALRIYRKATDDNPDYLDLVEKVKSVEQRIEEQKTRAEEKASEENVEVEEVKEMELLKEAEEEKIGKEVKRKVRKEVGLKERIIYI